MAFMGLMHMVRAVGEWGVWGTWQKTEPGWSAGNSMEVPGRTARGLVWWGPPNGGLLSWRMTGPGQGWT